MENNINYILPDNMLKLGFENIPQKDEGYLKYENNATYHWNKAYNKQYPEPKGKVIIYVNTTHTKYDEHIFVNIRQDADTRTVYNGICPSEEFLKTILSNIR